MSVVLINEVINLSQEIVDTCQKHSTDFAASRVYKDTRQLDIGKLQQDAFNGKLAEFAVYERLIANGFECNLPDTEIYAENKRSWRHDLTSKYRSKVYNISVKTCERNSNSWVFQANFSGRYDKSIFDNSENHLIYLTEILSNSQVFIFAAIPAKEAVKIMKLPRLRKLFGLKLCLYKEDVERLITSEPISTN